MLGQDPKDALEANLTPDNVKLDGPDVGRYGYKAGDKAGKHLIRKQKSMWAMNNHYFTATFLMNSTTLSPRTTWCKDKADLLKQLALQVLVAKARVQLALVLVELLAMTALINQWHSMALGYQWYQQHYRGSVLQG